MTEIINLYYEPSEAAWETYRRRGEHHAVHLLNHGNLSGSEGVEFVDDPRLAKLNPHICEWTSLIHAYRHISPTLPDCERVVFSHYRKFMANPERSVLLPFPFRLHTQESWTRTCHPVQTWLALKDALLTSHRGWKEERMFYEWAGLHEMPAPCCLFSLPNAMFREMVEFVSPMVLEAERRIPYRLEAYATKYQQRAAAFVGERLFSYWVWSRHPELLDDATPMLLLGDSGKPFSDMDERNGVSTGNGRAVTR